MAEFSAAAGAVGVISLGIQVCQGLVSYCNAWKSHDKDIGDAAEKLTSLRLTLEALQDILPKVESSNPSALPVLQTVRRQISSSSDGLDKLHAALTKFQSLGTPTGFRESLRNFKQQSLFPFRKDILKTLQDTVKDLQAILGSAVQVLGMYVQVKQGTSLMSIETIAAGTTTKTEELQAKLEVINAKLDQTDMRVSRLPDTLEATILSQFEHLGRQINQVQSQLQLGASQQSSDIHQTNQGIVNLQLGLVQRPSLLHSVVEENRRQSSNGYQDKPVQRRCSCRMQSNYRYFGGIRRYWLSAVRPRDSWNLVLRSSLRVHHRDCPFYNEFEWERLVGLNVSYCGSLLAGAIKASISMTRGAGGLSISPNLTFCPVVPSNAPAFALLNIRFTRTTTMSEMQTRFDMCIQQLSRLYSERGGSPYDTDQYGNTVLHKACTIFREPFYTPDMNIDTFDAYFRFLRGLRDLGVPPNKSNTEGRTCLSNLVNQYTGSAALSRHKSLLTSLNLKMLEIGAELPAKIAFVVTPEDQLVLAYEFARFPDFAEAMDCNEISQAVLTHSECLVKQAIKHAPHLISKPNAIGQTPLHLSMDWPEGIQILLNAGADVDAADKWRLTPISYAAQHHQHEALRLLEQAGCKLHYHPLGYQDLVETLRADTIAHDGRLSHVQASVQAREATIDYIISLLRVRRQSLGNLVNTTLDPSLTKRLDMSPDKLLDHKASLAVAMLKENGIPVPRSLLSVEPKGKTVYHFEGRNINQARSLWQAGFRDVNELDDSGRSPLMGQGGFGYTTGELQATLELLAWFLSKGADLHGLQRYAFRTAAENKNEPWRSLPSYLTNARSSIRALHYIGQRLGHIMLFFFTPCKHSYQPSLSLGSSAKKLLRDIVSDTMRDACCCACSSGGCAAINFMLKRHLEDVRWRRNSFKSSVYQVLRYTRCVAELSQIEESKITWLRSEMIRIITFERLGLKHTCCSAKNSSSYTGIVIAELGDEEDKEEIRKEQEEQVEKLESLIVEFEDKYQALGVPFVEFLSGYWHKRMKEVLREEVLVDRDQLRQIGVVMDEDSCTSSDASYSDSESEEASESEDAFADAFDDREAENEEDD